MARLTGNGSRYILGEKEGYNMTSTAQAKASARYDAKATKQFMMKLNIKTDADILAKLDSVGNKQGYIKELIRADISKNDKK